MLRKTGISLLLILLMNTLFISTGYARAAKPLINPGQAEWGCKLSLSEVKKGIDTALLIKEWTPSDSKTGYTQGKIIVRGKHTLVVDINYTESTFTIKYKSSDNLKYKIDSNGIEKIHPNANSWMNNLKIAITTVLKGKCS